MIDEQHCLWIYRRWLEWTSWHNGCHGVPRSYDLFESYYDHWRANVGGYPSYKCVWWRLWWKGHCRRFVEDEPTLERRLSQYPHELSGGMRQRWQRVCIAMAVAGRPKILICDEPNGSWYYYEAQILRLMQTLAVRGWHIRIIFVSQSRVIAQICDRVMVMYAGNVLSLGYGRWYLLASLVIHILWGCYLHCLKVNGMVNWRPLKVNHLIYLIYLWMCI